LLLLSLNLFRFQHFNCVSLEALYYYRSQAAKFSKLRFQKMHFINFKHIFFVFLINFTFVSLGISFACFHYFLLRTEQAAMKDAY
jgi:hypothetical protein